MKTRTLNIRMSEEDSKLLERKAGMCNMSKSVFIRHLINKEEVSIKRKASFVIKNLFARRNYEN